MPDSSVGVYVHVPFCERICPYCDFAVVAARRLEPERERRYVDALLRELAARRDAYTGRRLVSLYLGGGTPSLLSPESIARIVDAVRAAFPIFPSAIFPSAPTAESAEVTLEVNPSSVERERLPGFAQAGVNRVSVGVQSFDDTTLRRLGRAHKAEECHHTLAACRAAGFENVSLDLIVAAPGQTRAALEADLAATIAFGPEHVATYELTVEPGTPFELAQRRGQLAVPEEDEAAEFLARVEERLGSAGYGRYEISNYSRPGREAVHNRRYWQRRPVLGLGMGAFSTEPPREGAPFGLRRANLRDLQPYLDAVFAGVPAPEEVFDAATARGEAVFLALREHSGLLAAPFEAEFGGPPRQFFASAIDELTAASLLEESPAGDLRLTPRGRSLADTVFANFV